MVFLFIFFILLSSASAKDILVEATFSGGFAGTIEELTVLDDGEVILRNKNLNKVFFTKIDDKEMLDNLKSLLNQMPVKGSYVPERPVSDGFTYKIFYKGRRVFIQDFPEDVPEIPESLLQLLSTLKLIKRYAIEGKRISGNKVFLSWGFKYIKFKSYPEAVRAYMLNDASVVYYFEKKRPPTEEEKAERERYFETQWRDLERKAPELQKEIQKEAERSKESVGIPFFSNFFNIAGRLLSAIVGEGLKIGYTAGKRAFVNQPVVEEAGFIFEFWGKVKKIPVNLQEVYGDESWKRMPAEARIFASKDGRFVALAAEKGGILLCEIKNDEPSILSRFDGIPPAGFSSDGRYFYYTVWNEKEKMQNFFVVKLDENKIVSVITPPRRLENITDRLIVKDYFIVLGWKGLLIYNVNTGEMVMEFPKYKNGGRSMVEMPDEKLLIANLYFGLTELDLKTFTIKDYGLNIGKLKPHGIAFQKLVSVDPTGRYVAALYEADLLSQGGTERSRLFVWDLIKNKVVFIMKEDLDTISGGFGGYTPPAQITDDWRFLLVHRKDGGVYLYKRWWGYLQDL